MDKREGKIHNRIIKVFGNVQGIGFRPYVAELAKRQGVCGYIKNTGGTAEIGVQGSIEQLNAFINGIKQPKLAFASVTSIQELDSEPMFDKIFTSFKIEKSNSEELTGGVFIPPDLPLCTDCEGELDDVDNRRFAYALNSCASCGPRFSIIKNLPYDRENITMEPFKMCSKCEAEYTTGGNRRHHAQTIGCKSCGPNLMYYGKDGKKEAEVALKQAIEDILSGKIVAVKGIGGYHLACLPEKGEAVEALRILKGRDEKPFAVMFPNISQIEKVCDVSACESELLISAARPIVILNKKKEVFSFEVTGENDTCGCFLPYTVMQVMILRETGPLVMTSANKSSSPIINGDDEIKEFFDLNKQSIFAGVLYHDREILRRLDDSVAKVAVGQVHLIRRSRGYVPQPIKISVNDEAARLPVVSMGGDLKSSFCLAYAGYVYMSQYIGDLENDSVIKNFKTSYEDLKRLVGITPEIAVCDSHPLYYSSAFAKETGLSLVQVQHHHAHIASVVAEHSLDGPVLGVSFDGTGYGEDTTVWGGEFLVCEGASFKRAGHLKTFKQLGGDSSAKDALKIANCMLYCEGMAEYLAAGQDKKLLMAALEHSVNTVESSSMGRLFDTASSILGICHYNSYEGKCAVLLEQSAMRAVRMGKPPLSMKFYSEWEDGTLKFSAKGILLALLASKDVEAAALGFHEAVVKMIVTGCLQIAKKENITSIALSGGVFQNKLLLERSVEELIKQGFKVFWNRLVPPNDGGIALGQAYIALLKEGE